MTDHLRSSIITQQTSTYCHIKSIFYFFFFNDTATTEIYTLSLHDALPIFPALRRRFAFAPAKPRRRRPLLKPMRLCPRSEEHTSELQSLRHLVCRLLLEKKKNTKKESFEFKRNNTTIQ